MFFETIRTVSKDEFITVLKRNEHEAEQFKSKDPTAWNIIYFHEGNDRQVYKLIYLHQDGFGRLVMPHHNHDNRLFVSREGGDFWKVIDVYLTAMGTPQQAGRECTDKVRRLVELKTWETRPTFVSNDPDFAIPGHYDKRPGEFFYGGGYHRLIACGVWMKENNQYPSLTLYYCELLG